MSTLTPKKFALIASITATLVAPAFADDASKSAVLRDVGTSASQGAQTPRLNALSAETARAQHAAPHRAQRPAGGTRRTLQPAEVNSSVPFDFERFGHN
jgi:hypothetical protein